MTRLAQEFGSWVVVVSTCNRLRDMAVCVMEYRGAMTLTAGDVEYAWGALRDVSDGFPSCGPFLALDELSADDVGAKVDASYDDDDGLEYGDDSEDENSETEKSEDEKSKPGVDSSEDEEVAGTTVAGAQNDEDEKEKEKEPGMASGGRPAEAEHGTISLRPETVSVKKPSAVSCYRRWTP